MGKKNKGTSSLGFKSYLGGTMMWAVSGVGAALMTSWFMQYLTDYAGIGEYAALLGTVILLIVRIFDAVNDPIQGFIIDNAKDTKHGKYKPFLIASVILSAVGISCLFFLPSAISDKPVIIVIWVLFFYLAYDFGESWFAPNLLYRTMTDSTTERSKLLLWPRLFTLLLGAMMAALIPIINGVNVNFNNMHTSFGITVTGLMVIAALIAIVGLLIVKEKKVENIEIEEKSEKVKFTEIFKLFVENEALRVKFITDLFSGFIWTFLFATALYYIKWGFAANLETGEVNADLYGTYSLIASMMMLVPIILGTAIATPLTKLFKSSVKLFRAMLLTQALSCGLLFALEILGVLQAVPFVFFICMALTSTAIGVNFIPGEVMNMEVMDYSIFKNGKDRSALCNATSKFLAKAQTALSSALVGAILIGIGYQVDSATDTYLGDLARIPGMLTWFIIVMGLIPFVLGMISWFVIKRYPITNEVREEMHQTLKRESIE